jgi:hypothetical protein
MQAAEFDDYSMSENLVTYSNDFSSSIWTYQTNNTGVVGITTNATSSPGGINDAYRYYVQTGGGTFYSIYRNISVSANTSYAYSAFLKVGESTTPRLVVFDNVSSASITINLSTGTITNTTSTANTIISSSSIVSCDNNWYRCSLIFSSTLSGSFQFKIDLGTTTVNQGLFVYGAQLEIGTTATDYTPTTTTAKTRVLSSTTNTNITGLGTYYSSGFDENIGFTTFLPANISPPYDPVYDEFGGTLFGAGQGRYMRQYTDKSVIVYNEIDEVTDFRDIVRTGLVLDLDAAQPLSYKGTGTSWNDLSGTGNNGTLVNTPTYDTSGYFNFDYTQSESVSFSSSSSIQFLNRSAYTLEAWVYPTRNPGAANYTGIFDREDTSTGSRDGYNIFFLGSATTDTYFYTERFVAGVNGFTFITLNQSVSVNNWSHIVATYDGTTLTLYRNGSSVGTPATTTGNITNTSKTLTVGVRGGNYFGGRIANAKIYNRALTATEITQNYNALKHRFGL